MLLILLFRLIFRLILSCVSFPFYHLAFRSNCYHFLLPFTFIFIVLLCVFPLVFVVSSLILSQPLSLPPSSPHTLLFHLIAIYVCVCIICPLLSLPRLHTLSILPSGDLLNDVFLATFCVVSFLFVSVIISTSRPFHHHSLSVPPQATRTTKAVSWRCVTRAACGWGGR